MKQAIGSIKLPRRATFSWLRLAVLLSQFVSLSLSKLFDRSSFKMLKNLNLFPAATEETKRKMYSSVLLIGGGFMFNGAQSALQSRLQAKLPASHRKLVDQVDVIARPKVSFPPPVRYLPALTCVWLKGNVTWLTKLKLRMGNDFLKKVYVGTTNLEKFQKKLRNT